MVVDHRGQQVMGTGDRVEIAGEMKVHILHRHDLSQTTARSTAFHPEIRAERGFADTDRGVLADAVQTIAQTNGCRCLALTRRGGVDGGDKDQLAVLPIRQGIDEILSHLGLVMAKGQQMFGGNSQLGPDLLDRFFLGVAGDFDIGTVGHRRISCSGSCWGSFGIGWGLCRINWR